MRSASSPRPWVYLVLCAGWAAGAIAIAAQSAATLSASGATGARAWALAAALGIVGLAASTALFYLLGFVLKSLSYLARREPPPPAPESAPEPTPIAVLYLTSGDFDPTAVDSLLRLDGPGPRLFVLHDDGDDAGARARMERFLEEHPRRPGWEVAVWHRPERRGGKAGAVNWVLGRLEARWRLMLLCDSDSIALDPGALTRSAAEFEDPAVAVVQFRNAGYRGPDEPAFLRRLAGAIDVFDVFATPQAAWGYLPFFGHNALLRVDDLRRLGGLTPGFFSDDLDYSVRLTLAGRRIAYRRDIAFAERHPSDWASFRKRARKWALGCMQVLRARGREVLTTPGVCFAHRIGMLEFMGFYPAQALLLLGLLAGHLALPWLAPAREWSAGYPIAGSLVAAALLMPTWAWSAREGRLRGWPALAWSCVLVYGGSIVATARGVLDGLSRRDRPWVPTNLAERRPAAPRAAWAESALGLALFAVPWAFGSALVAFPASYLFIATFLCAPLTAAAYRPEPGSTPKGAGSPAARLASGARTAGWLLAITMSAWAAGAAGAPRAEVRGPRLFVDGAPFQVRGIHYSPWTPGTGPDGRSAFPGAAVVDRDLESIRGLGANTLFLHDAPGWALERAHAAGFVLLYAFHVGWHDTSRTAFEDHAGRILAELDSLRNRPGILAWILGNEVPPWVVDQLGPDAVAERIAELARRARALDPGRLLGHANWPPTKDLDLSFLDLACFNLYPAWPYEVAVKGFGPYLREVLAPRAGGRPLLVTEFGINSLEAGEARQAEILASCWREIASGPAVGGVLFEWCDEWWKNFDNPIAGKGYWERAYAPDDAATHDPDPEEHYGIVRTDRSPKAAYAAVRAMWAEERRPGRSWAPWIVVGAIALGTWLAFFGLVRRTRGRAAREAAAGLLILAGLLAGASRTAGAAAWTRADTLSGERADDQFGWAVAGAGDLDGDGAGDLVVGARFHDVGAMQAAGAAYVYRGGQPPGAPWLIRLEGRSADEHFGESLAGGADVDGDGRPDLAVGAPLRAFSGRSGAGAVDLFRGGFLGSGRWTEIGGEASDDWFGQSVALGDLDGDGRAEVVVGAPYNDRGGSAAGAVFVYRGGSAPLGPPLILVGEGTNNHFGWAVACVGDVNGDGFGDLVVGARLHGTGLRSAAGKVYLFHGGSPMDATPDGSWVGEARDDWLGNSVAGPGDVDGGGRPDILAGAPFNDRGGNSSGAAFLFRGEDPPGSAPAAVYVGESANAQLGWAVGRAGDVDGDGRPEVIAGARLQSASGMSAAGRAYLFPGGAPLRVQPIATASGERADDWLGHAVGGGSDFFRSGRGAVAVGAPLNDSTAPAAGRAYALGIGDPLSAAGRVSGHGLLLWPNPAARSVTVSRAGAPGAVVRFEVSDVAGRAVRVLESATDAAGMARVSWDARDAAGRQVEPGLYFVRAAERDGGVTVSEPAARVVVLR